MFFSGFVNNICFNIGADRQVFAFRESYLRNVLFLDMRHYDGLDIYGVPTSMGQHTNALKVASGQQLGTFIASVCQFFAGLIIAMVVQVVGGMFTGGSFGGAGFELIIAGFGTVLFVGAAFVDASDASLEAVHEALKTAAAHRGVIVLKI